MGASALKWAKRQAIDDRTLRAVLLAIAGLAKGHECAHTQAKIAGAANLKDRAVRNALAALEHFQLIKRERRQDWSKRGRAADLIALSVDRDFTVAKEDIMRHRSMGPTGTGCRINAWDQPAPDAGAPTTENQVTPYKERARSVITDASPSKSSISVRVSTRVRFDRGRGKWRANITAFGITMELGRFDTKDDAKAYAQEQKQEVIRNSTIKAGAPAFPAIHPSIASLRPPELGTWLFGGEGEASTEGVGAAGAMGQGTKFLAGMGGAHEEVDQGSLRARTRDAANDHAPCCQVSFKLP